MEIVGESKEQIIGQKQSLTVVLASLIAIYRRHIFRGRICAWLVIFTYAEHTAKVRLCLKQIGSSCTAGREQSMEYLIGVGLGNGRVPWLPLTGFHPDRVFQPR